MLQRLFTVIVAILLGCGGVIAIFYALNYAVNLLPQKVATARTAMGLFSPCYFRIGRFF